MLKVSGLPLACVALLLACDYNNDGMALSMADAGSSPTVRADAGVADAGALDAGPSQGLLDAALQGDASSTARDAPADANERSSNESFETAQPFKEPNGVLQDIVRPEQTNYFSFDAALPGFYELRVTLNEYSPDVVLSLYDEGKTLLATNDQGSLWPGDNIDARVVVKLDRTGRYYVKVYDPSTEPAFFTKSSFSLRYYRLDVRKLKADSEGFTFADQGALTPVTFSIDGDSGYSYTTVLGTMLPSTVENVAFTGLHNHALIGHLLAAGPKGDGSSVQAGPVRVLDSTQHLLAESEGGDDHLEIFPPISEGSYRLTVGAPAVVGDNAFYAVDLVMLPDNPREQQEASNGVLAMAEPFMLRGSSQQRGLMLAEVPGGDVDYYRFAAMPGQTLLLSCSGEASGSGVRKLHAELRDATDQTLVTAAEADNHNLDIASYDIPSSATYYLRLWSDADAQAGAADPWVRCVVVLSS